MRRRSALSRALLPIALALAWRADAGGRDVGPRPPGRFDYYVLSLSWVPGFCATHRGQPSECATRQGSALHGLWPQLNGGDQPSDCQTLQLARGDIERYGGLFASRSLAAHEWRRHGTCSGLSPAAYFALAARDVRRIRIPDADGPGAVLRARDAEAVKSAFAAANPGLSPRGMATVAYRGMVAEVDICLTKAGDFRPC